VPIHIERLGGASLQDPGDQLRNATDEPPFGRSDEGASALVARILERKSKFGITRLAAITGLDRVRLPVAQVVRPLSLSNAVAQGKGLSLVQAAASALMESIETWAAERIDPARTFTAKASELGGEAVRTFGSLVAETPARWIDVSLPWMTGSDLLSGKRVPVPVALVDTVYTVSSRSPDIFPRTTTGLGAGRSLLEAVVHAGLEIIERHAIALARRTIGFFDDCQIDNSSIRGEAASILQELRAKDFIVGFWRVSTRGDLPAYWCHLIPPDGADEFAPMPAEGFAADFSDDRAILRAVLEAAQSRLSAISGTREDITREAYPKLVDRQKLDTWRQHVMHPLRTMPVPRDSERSGRRKPILRVLLDSLAEAGAQAVILVPLYESDEEGLRVVRLVAPPLRHGW
jgi:ribosomal protein S12 methylthiotransferase accessory factor